MSFYDIRGIHVNPDGYFTTNIISMNSSIFEIGCSLKKLDENYNFSFFPHEYSKFIKSMIRRWNSQNYTNYFALDTTIPNIFRMILDTQMELI